MRQWMVDPKVLCNKHLFGEHVEHHMFVGTINKGTKVDGYLKNNLLEPLSLKDRHDELAQEILMRGFNHKSDLPEIDYSHLTEIQMDIKINMISSGNDLISRCEKCRDRYIKEIKNDF